MSTTPAAEQPRRSFGPSREGLFVLGVALFLLLVGLFKGINLLALLACLMLAVGGLNVLLAGRRLQDLEARRRIDAPVFAGRPFKVEVTVRNVRPTPQQAVRLEDGDAEHAVVWFLPRLGGGETVRLSQTVALPHRGRYAWGPLRGVSGYPFGLVRRQRDVADQEELIVLPRLGRLHRGRLRLSLARAGG